MYFAADIYALLFLEQKNKNIISLLSELSEIIIYNLFFHTYAFILAAKCFFSKIGFRICDVILEQYFLWQLVSAEGSNVSDGASQCTDSMAHSEAKHDRVDHVTPGHGNRGTAPLSHDDTLTETESIISSRQGHHLHKSARHHSEKYEKYNKYNGTITLLENITFNLINLLREMEWIDVTEEENEKKKKK